MIILNSQQTDFVRGETSPGHYLVPREMLDGNFILPESVLLDQAHAMHHEFLASLPTGPVGPEDFPHSE